MAEIPGITERAPQRPMYVNQAAEMAKGQAVTEKGTQLIRDVAALLGTDRAVRVTNTAFVQTAGETGTMTGATGIPALDNPDDPKAQAADLEKLIAYLKLENDQQQAEMAKDRIELQKGELEKRHAEQIDQLKETLAEMDKAAKASLLTKIFGWLMAALAVVFAVVASVATGGVAIGAVVGAVAAVTLAALNEAGVVEELTEKLAEALKDAGMSEMAAQIMAAVIMAVASIVLTVGAGAGTGAIANAIAKSAETAAKVAMTSAQVAATAAKTALEIGMGAMGAATTLVGGAASYQGYKAGMAQADLSEMEKFMAVMRQQLEESQEELEAILNQIQNGIAAIIDILSSETDTQREIASQIGAMA